jgi:hypothetical protein
VFRGIGERQMQLAHGPSSHLHVRNTSVVTSQHRHLEEEEEEAVEEVVVVEEEEEDGWMLSCCNMLQHTRRQSAF